MIFLSRKSIMVLTSVGIIINPAIFGRKVVFHYINIF